MIFAQVDVPAILAATVPLAVAIIGGGLTMAWRLGGLERTVKDLVGDVKDMRTEVKVIDAKTDAASAAATAAAAAAAVVNTRTSDVLAHAKGREQ